MSDKNENRTPGRTPSGFHKAIPVILMAFAVFTAICFITKSDTGMLGGAISGVLLGLFSIGAYLIPALLALHAIFYISDLKEGRLLSRVIFSLITVLAVSMMTHAITNWSNELVFDAGRFYTEGVESVGGGFIGGVIAFLLMSFLGKIGVIILSAVLLVIYFIYFFSRGSFLVSVGRWLLYAILSFFAFFERLFGKMFGGFKRRGQSKQRKKDDERTAELSDDEFFDVDNGMERLEISDLGIVESRTQEAMEASPMLQEQVHVKSEDTGSARERTVDFDTIFFDEEPVARTERTSGPLEDTTSSFTPKQEDIVVEDISAADSDSADSVFGRDFDPYSIAIAEELANKPSSRSLLDDEPQRTSATVTEDIDDITEEELERRRRTEDFERRKQFLSDMAKKEQPAAAPSSSPKTVEFRVQDTEDLSEHTTVESEVWSVRIGKTEQRESRGSTGHADVAEGAVEDIYGTIYSPVGGTATKSDEPQFKPFSAAAESGSGSEGLLFEFDNSESEPERLKVERTMLGAESAGEPVRYSAAEAAEERTFSITVDEDDEDEDIPTEDLMPEEDLPIYDEEIPPEEQNPFIKEARGMFDMFKNEDEPGEIEDAELPAEDTDSYDEQAEATEDEDDEPPFDFVTRTREEPPVREQPQPKAEPPKKKVDYSKYKFPPIDLLGIEVVHNEEEINQEIRENTKILIETLESFNVTASIKGVDRGPRVTRYEVVPARGVKVNQVTHLFDDIRLALAAEGVRMEAPIPGKAAIGFEIPNKNPVNVRLRELLECEEFVNARSNTFVCLGKDVAGNPIFGDIAKFPHALVAGATGMGKSVCINSIMISMLYKARPDQVKFIMIDPKKVEFKIYGGIPHLLIPVVTEAKQAAGALMWAVEEMERRYDLIEKYNIRNIEAFNQRAAEDPSIGAPMPKIVIVIDELNDLMMQVRDPVEDLIMRIAQKARAAGIHLIIGTQRPDVKVITGTIKANINTRISCKVTSVVDSRTILEMAGAEKLLNKGDMLFKPPDRTQPVRVQGCFVSDSEVEAIMDFLKQYSTGDQYDEEVLAEINKAAQKCGNQKKGGAQDDDGGSDDQCGYYSDQQFLDAVELAIRSGKISTSLLQRKCSIGFGKAARYIDAMEEIGIVSEPNGQKPRDVLITMDEWREKLSRVDFD